MHLTPGWVESSFWVSVRASVLFCFFWWKRTSVVFVLKNKLYKLEQTVGVFPKTIIFGLLSKQSW